MLRWYCEFIKPYRSKLPKMIKMITFSCIGKIWEDFDLTGVLKCNLIVINIIFIVNLTYRFPIIDGRVFRLELTLFTLIRHTEA